MNAGFKTCADPSVTPMANIAIPAGMRYNGRAGTRLEWEAIVHNAGRSAMGVESDTLEFKFYYIGADGNAAGFGAKRGRVTPTAVELKDTEIPHTAILDTMARDNRLILVVDTIQVPGKIAKHFTNGQILALQVSKAKPVELKKMIDQITSIHRAKRHKDELEAKGEGDTFRCLVCPQCEATLDVSGLPDTVYVHCPYCESIAQHDGRLIPSGERYRQCEECGWFDRVQGYTEFYFYFLLVLYGFSYKRRYLCDVCVNRVFWKVLLMNIIFILGIPPAIWMKIKSKLRREVGLREIARANTLARKGRSVEALQLYNNVLDRHPGHPGIHYDQALGALLENQLITAREFLDLSLQQCANYTPARYLLEQLDELEKQGN